MFDVSRNDDPVTPDIPKKSTIEWSTSSEIIKCWSFLHGIIYKNLHKEKIYTTQKNISNNYQVDQLGNVSTLNALVILNILQNIPYKYSNKSIYTMNLKRP